MRFSYEQGNNLKHNVASKHRRQEYFLNFQSVFYFLFFPNEDEKNTWKNKSTTKILWLYFCWRGRCPFRWNICWLVNQFGVTCQSTFYNITEGSMKFAGTASQCQPTFHLAWNQIWQLFHSRKNASAVQCCSWQSRP